MGFFPANWLFICIYIYIHFFLFAIILASTLQSLSLFQLLLWMFCSNSCLDCICAYWYLCVFKSEHCWCLMDALLRVFPSFVALYFQRYALLFCDRIADSIFRLFVELVAFFFKQQVSWSWNCSFIMHWNTTTIIISASTGRSVRRPSLHYIWISTPAQLDYLDNLFIYNAFKYDYNNNFLAYWKICQATLHLNQSTSSTRFGQSFAVNVSVCMQWTSVQSLPSNTISTWFLCSSFLVLKR